MRFIVFRELKDVGNKIVDRIYPIANLKYIQYEKETKVFKIRHTDDTWHTITNDGLTNEREFENFITSIKDKVVFR